MPRVINLTSGVDVNFVATFDLEAALPFASGNAQADENNDEWASGDPGTFAVRVSRDASGREIRWEFLSWK